MLERTGQYQAVWDQDGFTSKFLLDLKQAVVSMLRGVRRYHALGVVTSNTILSGQTMVVIYRGCHRATTNAKMPGVFKMTEPGDLHLLVNKITKPGPGSVSWAKHFGKDFPRI